MKRILILLAFAAVSMQGQTQQMLGFYYWIDDSFTELNFVSSPASEIVHIENQIISVNTLAPGAHRIYFRTVDSNGVFSSVVGRSIYIQPTNLSTNINALRYWVDDNTTDIDTLHFTNAATTVDETFIAELCDQAAGTHRIYFQVRDSQNRWSSVVPREVTISNPGAITLNTVTLSNDTLFNTAQFGNQWYDSNGIIDGANQQFFIPDSDGTYYSIVTTACDQQASNIVEVNVCDANDLPQNLQVSGDFYVCEDSPAEIVATAIGANSYSWTLPSGWSGESNTSNIEIFASTGVGEVMVMAENECGYGSPFLFTITSSPLVTPAAIITASDVEICDGEEITFQATIEDGGDSPLYQWILNGIPESSQETFTSTTINDGDVVSCTITSSEECVASSQASSNSITIDVFPIPLTPTITVDIDNVLTSSVTSGNQWLLNGTPIDGATEQTYTPTLNGTYSVEVTDINGCGVTVSNDFVWASVFEEVDNSINLFPNPFSNNLNIVSSRGDIIERITLFDARGSLVLSLSVNASNAELNELSMASGFYTLRIDLHDISEYRYLVKN